ncbi:uncharacterized protein [Centruroides vittatus]|uniref:uncharacterized protein n=1 Tax=Centruroides vittatus TaxID=120091 RepID=UPI00350F47AC
MSKMNLEQAQDAFDKFLEGVDEYHVADFLNYINRRWFIQDCRGEGPAIAYMQLRDIAEDIKSLVPFNAILPSEKVIQPKKGENADCDPQFTEHVDAFLYESYELDDLERENKLTRYYCKKCHSREIVPLTFISHSASRRRIEFIFNNLVPFSDAQCILDVGSRLGAMLYGAYLYTKIPKIVGIELNEDLCKIQRQIIQKHKMEDRIEIICDDICNQPEAVKSADIIILNNVFEFFQTEDQQIKAWEFLRKNITKPKTRLITIPSLESTLSILKTSIDLKTWVRKFPITDPIVAMSLQEHDELSEVCVYEVI